MQIINKENYFSNKQIDKFMSLFEKAYIPSKLIICENRLDILKICSKLDKSTALSILIDITVWAGKTEAEFIEGSDTIIVYIFSQNDDGDDRQSKQLYSLHALVHELRHRYYTFNNIKISLKFEEEDCDIFATKFIRKKSKTISEIMKWKDEWEVEEEC